METKRKNDQLEYDQATDALIEAMYDWYVSEPSEKQVGPYWLSRLLGCARQACIKAMHTETREAVAWSDKPRDDQSSHYDSILAELVQHIGQLDS